MELYHYGIKGQKWGIRRYRYADGSLTPLGRKRYGIDLKKDSGFTTMESKLSYAAKLAKTKLTGKQYVDSYLKAGTALSRIQTSENFENFAFYATYKKQDSNKYMGLFGNNLITRAHADAKNAEKLAKASGSEEDIKSAKALKEKANNTKVYQLKLEATKKLKIPSDDNASDITINLLKEEGFRNNLIESIRDSKEKMRRPTQQILFSQAQNALKKNINKMSKEDKIAVYKAFNLSLVNHNSQEIAAQNRFYKELKKKGYNALLDYNDKEFSSYHAKRPMIIFDLDSVKLKSVTAANPKVVNKLHFLYNTERIIKEIPANTIGLISKYGTKTVSECNSYINSKIDDYLGV